MIDLAIFSNDLWDQKSIFSQIFPYIEIGEIDLSTGKINQINNINIKEAPSRARMIVRSGDILISTTRPGRGAISYIENNDIYIASTGFSVIRELRIKNMSKKFLFYWLRQSCSLWQMEQRSSGGNYPAITQNELEYIKIPLPPQEIQAQIVAKMDNAYAAKKQKEAEAQQLLGSIDNYLLGELGIELPQQQQNTIETRMFTRRFSDISGGRFDPFFNSLNKQDKLGKYPFVDLKQLALIRKGNSITKDKIIEGNIPVIAGGQTSPYNHNVANNNGDIITVSASGYAGYVWYHENPVFASDCTMISSLNTNNISNKFLFEYLKSQQQDIYNLRSGAIQPHVYPSDLSRIKIPIPPLEKQMEIVHYIANLRNKANELQQQAQDVLEQAKQQVENMLLENK